MRPERHRLICLLVCLLLFGELAFAATATPSFSTGTGTYYAPVSVSISDGTSGSTIYYTADGSTPTAASTVYSAPVTVSSTTTLKAIAVNSASGTSAVASATFTISAPLAPSFSSGTGTYYAPLNISISEGTRCAVTYYTADGSTPTAASAQYTSPITVSGTITLKAIAACPGGAASSVASAAYTISPAKTPSFSTGTGTYYAPVNVTISEGTSGAVVYYTTNGSTPTTASTVYSGPINVSSTATLKAIAVYPGGTPSPVVSASYTISTPLTPSFSKGTGTYYAPVNVTISEGTSGAVIYYTTNGSTPTTTSTVYSGPVNVSSTATLKAIAVYPGGTPSPVVSASYTISTPLTPSFSTGTGTYYAPVNVTISEGTSGAVVYYTTNGSTPTTASTVYSGAIKVSASSTLEAVAVYPGGSPSAVAIASYKVVSPATPVLSVPSGTYEKSVSVAISDTTSGAVIYYTTDGTTPSTASSIYGGAISLANSSTFSTTVVLNAIAVFPGGSPSAVASGSYTILSTTTPVHSQNTGVSFFGMNVGVLNGTPWPPVPVGALRILGAQTEWSNLNPSSGTYAWTNLDREILAGQSNGAQLLYTFTGTPPWAIATNLEISAIQRAGGVVTVTTATPHGLFFNPVFTANQQSSIVISGVGDSSYDGTFVLTGTPTASSLTYSQAGPDSTSSSGSLSAVCGGIGAPSGCAEAPVNLANWDLFVNELISHVGPGVIQYWELWNEANTADTWRGDPKLLVAMAADAAKIIKAADPNAVILSPSTTINFETPAECAQDDPRCGSTWLNNWLAAGGKSSINGVAFHGYPQVTEAPEQIQGAVTLLQVAMNQNGVGSLPLMDTESSWGQNVSLPNTTDQVAFLGRHLLLEESMGVQQSFWYAYDNAAWGTLWTSLLGLNPVGDAYQQIVKWIEGATITQPCAATSENPALFTCGYSRANGYSALAVWNSAGSSSFTVPQGYVQYRDLYGNLMPATQGSVTLTTSPILLENKSVF